MAPIKRFPLVRNFCSINKGVWKNLLSNFSRRRIVEDAFALFKFLRRRTWSPTLGISLAIVIHLHGLLSSCSLYLLQSIIRIICSPKHDFKRRSICCWVFWSIITFWKDSMKEIHFLDLVEWFNSSLCLWSSWLAMTNFNSKFPNERPKEFPMYWILLKH